MTWGSFSYAFGPVLGLIGVGVLVLILRWAYKPGASLVEKAVRPSSTDNYGILVPVAHPVNYAELLRTPTLKQPSPSPSRARA